jgi:hypothetical protein
MGAVLVPMRDHPDAGDPGLYSSDRLHANARGHAVVGTESVRALAAAIPAQRAATPLAISFSMEEILSDLAHPGPLPGAWNVPAGAPSVAG